MTERFAFVITQLGSPGSEVRSRADDVCNFIIQPVLDEYDMALRRSDEDPTPGSVTTHIVRSILECDVVIADLTGRNPNVYYELGIADSFGRPVVVLIDNVSNLSFDVTGQRVIAIGDKGTIGAREAKAACEQLGRQIAVALSDGFSPTSVVSTATAFQSADKLAPGDPLAAELRVIRDQVGAIRAKLDAHPSQGPRGRTVGAMPDSFTVASGPDDPGEWSLGEFVYHEKFGRGIITDVSGAGEKTELHVSFEDVGQKILLAAWAPLGRIVPLEIEFVAPAPEES